MSPAGRVVMKHSTKVLKKMKERKPTVRIFKHLAALGLTLLLCMAAAPVHGRVILKARKRRRL